MQVGVFWDNWSKGIGIELFFEWDYGSQRGVVFNLWFWVKVFKYKKVTYDRRKGYGVERPERFLSTMSRYIIDNTLKRYFGEEKSNG